MNSTGQQALQELVYDQVWEHFHPAIAGCFDGYGDRLLVAFTANLIAVAGEYPDEITTAIETIGHAQTPPENPEFTRDLVERLCLRELHLPTWLDQQVRNLTSTAGNPGAVKL